MRALLHKVDKLKFILTNVQFCPARARRDHNGLLGSRTPRLYGTRRKGFLPEKEKIFLTLLT